MTTIICVLAFVCGFLVYRTGFKDGQRTAEGRKMKPLIQKKQKLTEEEKRINQGIENILNYANRRNKEVNR